MPMGERDKRALIVAAAAVAVFVIFRFGIFPAWDAWQQQRVNLETQAATLAKYRAAVAASGARNAAVTALEERLREAERGLLNSRTAALAAAEMQEVVKQLTTAQSIEIRSSDFLPTRPLGAGYLEVPLGLQFQCRLDQLVSFLNAAEQSPKYLVVSKLSVQSTGTQEKWITVSMTVAGVMLAEEGGQ